MNFAEWMTAARRQVRWKMPNYMAAVGAFALTFITAAHWVYFDVDALQINQAEPQRDLHTHNLDTKREIGSANHRVNEIYKAVTTPGASKPKPEFEIPINPSFNLSGASQEDPRLVDFVRQRIRPPALRSEPYNLKHPHKLDASQTERSTYADKEFLHGMTGGFFLEVGAVDGEIFSNTLYFERKYNWTGLLVEANPEDYLTLTTRGRKAYSLHAAISPSNTSGLSNFNRRTQLFGRLGPAEGNSVMVWRIPLYSMLLALNVTKIDFFSLDIEGDELEVLQTIPWDKITIRLMCVEVNHVLGGAPSVIEYMVKQDYVFLGIRSIDAWFGKKELIEETLHAKLHQNYMVYISKTI